MSQNNAKTIDLDRIFHYKNLPEKKRKIIIGVCVALFVVTSAVSMYKHSNRPVQPKIPPKIVEVGSVIKKDVPVYVDSFGTLASPKNVDIRSQVTGKISEVCFEEGQMVSAGDRLFIIDPSEYVARLNKAEATLSEDLAELKLKSDILIRNRGLVKRDLISQQEFERYETDVVVTAAKIELDKAEIALAKIYLGYCYILSPINGLTGKRQVDAGNIVEANTGPVLVNVKEVDKLYMDFTIPERNLPRVREAMAKETLKVVLSVTGDESAHYEGKLEFMENSVNDLTGTVFLRANVANEELKLWAGQFAKVRLILGTIKNAVLAPYPAVQLGQNGAYVFTVSVRNKADLKLVTTGQQEKDHIVIEKGLKPGEKVVTAGQLGLRQGVSVKIES